MIEKKTSTSAITEADINRIMASAPDYIQDASDEIQDLYIASEWAKELRDLSPRRYYDCTVKEGTPDEQTFTIDFQQTVNVGSYIKTRGGTIEDVRKANGSRLLYLQLERQYQRTVLELNKAMGTKLRKPRNIVDYTGTIMELFGKFYTVADVATIMKKEYRIRIPEDELKKFYVEHRDLITKRRAEYVLQNKDFRVATETGRLEVLNTMLVEVEMKNRAAGGSNVDYCNLILRIIEQARKEVKGNDLKLTVDGQIDINATLHAESNIGDVMKQLSINSIVIGLTAAKAGLDPAVLIGQLAYSWYAQFNGFNGNVIDDQDVQLPSALIRQYNWEEVEKESRKFVDDFKPIEAVTEESDTTAQNRAEDARKALLMRLKAVRTAQHTETGRANPNVGYVRPEGLKDDVMIPTPDADSEEPQGDFAIDYDGNRQGKGMKIVGDEYRKRKARKVQKEEGVPTDRQVDEALKRREARRAKMFKKK